MDSEIRIWIFPNKTHLWFYASWLNLNREVILLKRWFLRKKSHTDIGHFEVQGVYLSKKVGGGEGGEVKYQNILATIQGLEGVSRDPRFDAKYGEGLGITQNLSRGYGM